MINIIIGTETGTAEFVADELTEYLSDKDIPSSHHIEPNGEELIAESQWLICTSTQGAGELPANLHAFQQWLTDSSPDLTNVNVVIIGLGDRSYDQFCGGAKWLFSTLKELGANFPHEPLYIDAQLDELPEDIAIEWLEQNKIY